MCKIYEANNLIFPLLHGKKEFIKLIINHIDSLEDYDDYFIIQEQEET